MIVNLVMPEHADGTPDRLSVISPLGMALFGYAAGDRLDWGPHQRPIRLKVNRVRRIRRPHS
jgi:transcription elongation GreA/GreB family factor